VNQDSTSLPGFKVTILPGTYDCRNLGDLAMLKVCLERVRKALPVTRVNVLTAAPSQLEKHCPGIIPIPLKGRNRWLDLHALPRFLAPSVPPARRARLKLMPAGVKGMFKLFWPGQISNVRTFTEAFFGSDLFLMSGCGAINDVFWFNALRILATFDAAQSAKIPTAMFGQGIGPLEQPRLRRAVANTFRQMNLVGLRDEFTSLKWLEECGALSVPAHFTGDDALELATRNGTAQGERSGIGLSFRSTNYAKLPLESLLAIRESLLEAAREYSKPLVRLNLLLGGRDSDEQALDELLGGQTAKDTSVEEATPEKVIRRIGSCRIVITASYHAALFALGQGIPAICLAGSKYYEEKFRGLAQQFPDGCTILHPQETTFRTQFRHAVARLWNFPAAPLIASAEPQIRKGQVLYAQLPVVLESAGPMARARSR